MKRQQSCGTIVPQAMYAQGTVMLATVHDNQRTLSSNLVNAVNFQQTRNKKFGNRKKMFHCTFYNNNGHTVDRCYKRHGYPPNNKFKGKFEGNSGSIGNGYGQL